MNLTTEEIFKMDKENKRNWWNDWGRLFGKGDKFLHRSNLWLTNIRKKMYHSGVLNIFLHEELQL